MFRRNTFENLGEPNKVRIGNYGFVSHYYGNSDREYPGLRLMTRSYPFNIFPSSIYIGASETHNWIFNDLVYVGADMDAIKYKFGESARPSGTGISRAAIYNLDETGMPVERENAKVQLRIQYNADVNEVQEFSIRPLGDGDSFRSFPFATNDGHVSIYAIETGQPNSAGGVSLLVTFRNNNPERIRYIYFVVTPYNAVGDVVNCEVRRVSTIEVEKTGPIAPDVINSRVSFRNVWYNHNIRFAILESVRIIYMDREEVTLHIER